MPVCSGGGAISSRYRELGNDDDVIGKKVPTIAPRCDERESMRRAGSSRRIEQADQRSPRRRQRNIAGRCGTDIARRRVMTERRPVSSSQSRATGNGGIARRVVADDDLRSTNFAPARSGRRAMASPR